MNDMIDKGGVFFTRFKLKLKLNLESTGSLSG